MKIFCLRNNFEDVNISMKVYADELIRGLKCENNDLEINEVMPKSNVLGLLTAGIKSLKRFRNYYERYFLYPRCLPSEKNAIFHIVDHSFSYLLKRIEDFPTVVTCHDLILIKMMRGEFGDIPIPRFASFLFNKSIRHLRKASKIISVSENTKKDLIDILSINPEKIVTIYNGLDHKTFNITPEESAKKADISGQKKFTLLQVGREKPNKNVVRIIKALGMLDSRLKRYVKLLKIGGDFTKHQYELIAENGLEGNFEVILRSDKKDLASNYKKADILLFPSLYEGFGLPPLEAMACATPVITSDKSSIPEICSDAVHYVDPYDSKDISIAIEKLIEDPKYREELIGKGLKRAKEFSWEKTSRKVLSVYKEIATAL